MTSTLQKLLETGLVCDSDEISFQFKGHTFGARLMPGGLISHCTWNSEAVLQDKVAFTTLTDWCDTCIQELVDEYVTRFSSWKRVPAMVSSASQLGRQKPWESRWSSRSWPSNVPSISPIASTQFWYV